MELGELWKRLESDKLSKPVKGAVQVQKKSKHPVQKLKTAYLMTTAFAVLFLIAFVILFFLFDEWLVKVGMAVVILCYIFFFVTNFSMYKRINVVLPVDQSLKRALQYTHDFITENMNFQEKVSPLIYPIAGTAGFLLGGSITGANMEILMNERKVIIILITTLIILTPSCFYLTRWLYKISYGKCLKELKARIDELEKEG